MNKDKTNALQAEKPCSVGQALQAHRKIVPYTCEICGHQGEGYEGKKVCSSRCKQAKRYRRNKAQRTKQGAPLCKRRLSAE